MSVAQDVSLPVLVLRLVDGHGVRPQKSGPRCLAKRVQGPSPKGQFPRTQSMSRAH